MASWGDRGSADVSCFGGGHGVADHDRPGDAGPAARRCATARVARQLTIALAASVSGAESGVDFAESAEDREPLLREFLRLENGLPSRDTDRRVFRFPEPQAFGRAFEAFLTDLGADRARVRAIAGTEPGPWSQ